MKIIKLVVRNLHGSLNKEINFHDDLNILVGINGSGKTSVLNVIEWLIALNIPSLAVLQFSELALSLEVDNRRIVLKATQTEKIMVISVEGVAPPMAPIKVALRHKPGHVDSDVQLRGWKDHYSQLGPESVERPVWSFIEQLPRPVSISLDRNLSAEADKVLYIDPHPRVQGNKVARVKSPIDKVMEVTGERYLAYQSEVLGHNEELKARLVLSAFQDPFVVEKPGRAKRVSLNEIDRLEQKVTELLSSAIKDSNVQVAMFFQGVKNLIKHSPPVESKEGKVFWRAFASRFSLIDELAKAFEDYEKRISFAYSDLSRFLLTVNQFLADSSKELSFDDSKGALSFKYLDKDGKAEGRHKSIELLSSGERQILILMTFLAFVAAKDRVFIVDEPELSLHPKWQHEFLDAFKSMTPSGTQLIIATHSPEIVAGYRQKCLILEP